MSDTLLTGTLELLPNLEIEILSCEILGESHNS